MVRIERDGRRTEVRGWGGIDVDPLRIVAAGEDERHAVVLGPRDDPVPVLITAPSLLVEGVTIELGSKL